MIYLDDAEEIKSEFDNDELRIAKVVDYGKESTVQRFGYKMY